MSNNVAEVVVILGFLLFILGLIALPTVDRWMVLNYCEGANLTVEQCMTLLEK